MTATTQVNVGRIDNGMLVQLRGRGTMQISPLVQTVIVQAMPDLERIVIDLSLCEFLDSTFLGCLLAVHREATEHQKRLEVVADKIRCQKIFGPSRLDQVLRCVESAPKTTAEMQELPTTDIDKREFGVHVMQCHQLLASLGGHDADRFQQIADRMAGELKIRFTE